MERRIEKRVQQILKQHGRWKTWQKVVSALGCLVVFCTVYALILPAITASAPVICGQKEHIHTTDCYETELICSKTEGVAHVHDESCFEIAEEPVCGMEDGEGGHVHTDECGYEETEVLVCGLGETEGHQHSADCYKEETELTCTESEGHEHGEECYAESGELVCEEVGHQHDENCYETQEVLCCGETETEPHTHDASCYEEKSCWLCGMEAGEGGHRHDDLCFESVRKLICGEVEGEEHLHTDACYGQVLHCSKKAHTHTDECYDALPPEKLPEEKSEAMGDELTSHAYAVDVEESETGLGNWFRTLMNGLFGDEVTLMGADGEAPAGLLIGGTSPNATISAALYYRPAFSGVDWIPVTNGTEIGANASFRVKVDYANVDPELLAANGYRLCYKVEDYLTNINAHSTITVNGEIRGTVDTENGYVVLTFDEDWVDSLYSNGNRKSVTGDFSYQGGLDLNEIEDDGGHRFRLGGIDIEVPKVEDARAEFAEVNLEKAAENKLIHDEETDRYYLEYSLTVEAGQFGAPDVKLIDSLSIPAGKAYLVDKGYIGVDGTPLTLGSTDDGVHPYETITNGNAASAPGKVYLTAEEAGIRNREPIADADGTRLAWYIGEMAANESRTLTYRVEVDKSFVGIIHNAGDSIANQAKLYSKDYARGIANKNYEPTATAALQKSSANIRAEGDLFYVDYTIRVTANENNSYTLTNLKINDQANPGSAYASAVKMVEGSMKLYAGDGITEMDMSGMVPGGAANPRPIGSGDRDYDIFIGDLKPGESRVLRYTMTIDKAAAAPIANGRIQITNLAKLYSDEPRQNQFIV